jgi:hypothetical protein
MLPVFPSAYIDDSLLTAVLIGVLLLWWLSERFGWPATGLVVPGYLGSLFAVRPDAALVVVAEAVATYFVADLIGRRIPRYFPLDVSFGRDRFFLIILVSVLVRLSAEAGPFPAWLASVGLDRPDGWHSIGLVLVPLTANALWKPGFVAGAPLVGVPVIAVWLLLRLVLLPLTNLSLVSLELTYADLEWSFLATPRVYLLLLVGAFVASHTTVRFGWDFGGILVCGLLAIAWLDATKVLATFAEVIVVTAIVRRLVARPPLKTANLSGLRPIVLVFTVSYLLKLTLAFVGQGLWPSFRTADLFGFGYLLPALIATRVYRYKSALKVLIPTTAVSLAGLVGGSALGIGLAALRGVPEATGADPDAHRGPAWIAALDAVTPNAAVPDPALAEEIGVATRAFRSGAPYLGTTVRVDVWADGAVLAPRAGAGGVVLWRRDGDPSVAIDVVDAADPGVAEAGLAVAERLGAGYVALGARGAVRTLLAGADVVVPVTTGPAAGVGGTVAVRLALADVAPGVGEEPGVVLDDASRIRLALETITVDLPPAPYTPGSSAAYVRYDRGVVGPSLLALDDPAWLPLAAAHAARHGQVVTLDADSVRLTATGDGPFAVTARVRREGRPLVVDVRRPIPELAALGEAWFRREDAVALLTRTGPGDPDAERVWLRAVALAHPGADVWSLDVWHRHEDPGADVIVSDGRGAEELTGLGDDLGAAMAAVADHGLTVLPADGSERRARFGEQSDPRRTSIEPFGGSFLRMWVGKATLAEYGVGRAASLDRAVAAAAEVEVREQALAAVLPGQGARACPAMTPAWVDVEAFGRTGHPAHLSRLKRFGRVYVFTDAETARGYVVVEAPGCVGVAPLRYAGRPVRVGPNTLPLAWTTE